MWTALTIIRSFTWPGAKGTGGGSTRVLSGGWTGEVFRCPDYPGPTLSDPKTNSARWQVGSYGYNSYTGQRSLDDGNRAVREAEIKSPSEMIALGDGSLLYFPGADWGFLNPDGGTPRAVGLGVLWRMLANGKYHTSDPIKTREAVRRRHRDRYNVGFCDGHVESIQHDHLFAETDAARRRWHRDNEP